MFTEKIRFDVSISGLAHKGRVYCTKSRTVFFRRTPMGGQVTSVWHKDVEMLTSGKKKGRHYVQMLGEGSRILILFNSRDHRDSFKKLFRKYIPRMSS